MKVFRVKKKEKEKKQKGQSEVNSSRMAALAALPQTFRNALARL